MIADGRDAQYHVSWRRDGHILTLYSGLLPATLEAGSRQLTVHAESGHGFERGRDVGLPIHIAGDGDADDRTDFTTRITAVLDARNVLLADPSPIGLAHAAARLTWPCFRAEDCGKGIRIEGAVAVNPRNDQVPPGFGRQFYLNAGSGLALQTEIAAVNSPVNITLALPVTAPDAAAQVCRLCWGSDNTDALVAAGLAAIAAGGKELRFPSGLTCAWNITRRRNVGTVIGQLRWVGDDARVIVTDQDANELFVQPSGPAQRAFAPPARRVIARTQWPRTTGARAVTVAICGDSMSLFDLGGSPASSPVAAIIREIETQNPGKPFAWHDFSIGGATWSWLDQTPQIFPSWYTDRTVPWLGYVEAVSPDLVIAAIGGGNDGAAVSLAAMESVLAKIRAMPADADGNPPDLLLMNARPEGRWRPAQPPGPDADEVTDRWFWQAQREVPNQLQRTYAARHGLAFLDYEDVAQRVLWGWSHQRSALRRVPDCDPQLCSPSSPLRFRRQCRDYSLAVGIPGTDARAFWATAGSLSFQIGSRPDNAAIVGMSARGNLVLRVNAWGGTVRDAAAAIAAGSPILATAGDAVFDGDWAIAAGSNVLIHVRGGSWLTEADIGKPILLPRAGHNGEPLRSFIVWVGALPNQLGLADAAISSVGGGAGEVRYGGMLFMPSDARCGADICLRIGPTMLATTVAGYLDATRVALAEPWPGDTASGAPATIFIGRRSLPPTETALNLADLPGPDAAVSVYARGTQLFVGMLSARTARRALQGFRGNVIRYGGPFEPTVTPGMPGPIPLHAAQCYIDEPVFEGQVLTDYEMWGDGNPPTTSPWDGNGLNHLTHKQLATVDEPLLRVQDFAGDRA